MLTLEYNPTASFVEIVFRCPKCDSVCTAQLGVPAPDFTAETHHDSVNVEYDECYCEKCDSSFSVELSTGFYGGMCELFDVEDVLDFKEIYETDDYTYDRELFDECYGEIGRLLETIDPLDAQSKEVLYRLLYSNIITRMETFLADTLKSYVLSSEKNTRFFTENYKPFKKELVPLSDLYKRIDNQPSCVRQVLDSLMYHDLPKIKQVYKIINVDIGDIGDLVKAVIIRHDIVHRNGKDKDGNQRTITRSMVEELATKVAALIYDVSNQMAFVDTLGEVPDIFVE